ncbi:probable crossover junction endonuclease EME2 [Orycteropus afer afer]|uniref:Structure-specific endonuclease subunit EME2 n=1 Tax=Orycteropus afer afer TaxID=1230840 RepID=A0A8B6ZQ54_ORYAF|nr:probable crossover junction endonuclease EME2 [Orycteropus afer afer]
MARAGAGKTAGAPRGGRGQRRAPTWEISDSDAEGPASAEAACRARDPLRPPPAAVAVLEDAGADILLEALGALGCEPRIEPQPHPRSLSWSRVRPDPRPCGVPPEVWAADGRQLLLLLDPEEFLQGVAQLTQVPPTASLPWTCSESTTHLHLAVIGLDAHLWSRQRGVQRIQRPPEGPAAAQAGRAGSWLQVQEALVLLQLWADLDVLLVASWQELSDHVCAFTKALAQRPYKWLRESRAFFFCTVGRCVTGKQGAKDGQGLRGTWRRQIRQLNRVSPAVADAVVAAYPSPRLLQQALATCSSQQERLAFLADLPVEKGQGGRPRRVGPDLSRRLCLFLTTSDPDLLLDLGP